MSHEQAAIIASRTSYITAGGTVFAGLELNEWAVVVGIVATIITLLMNCYYKQQHLKIAREHFDVEDDG